MNFKWEQVTERFYNMIINEENFGVLYQGKNNEWVLSISGLSIREEGTYADLRKHAEKMANELILKN
jgi:hypothetical protein